MRIKNRRSVFFRLLCAYIIFAAVLIGLVMPIYLSAVNAVKDNARKDYENIVSEGAKRFSAIPASAAIWYSTRRFRSRI